MEKKPLKVCVLVAVLGIIVTAAGFIAEATRNKTFKDNYVGLEHEPESCDENYLDSTAQGFAITAAVALVLVRVVIAANTGSRSCCQHVPNIPRLALGSIYISWITSFIAIILFIAGAISNNKPGVLRVSHGQYQCYFANSAVFTIATIMGILSVIVGIVYYLKFVSAVNGAIDTSAIELEAPPVTNDIKPPITDGKP